MTETTNRFEETCNLLYDVCAMLSPPVDEAQAHNLRAECMEFVVKYTGHGDRYPIR